ncbi:TolC family protein, partial [Acinetobacter baumannii]
VRAAELTRATAALERQRRAAEDAYTAGQVSLLEVLDAERQRLSTEDQAIGARPDTLRAAVALHRALGG